MYLGIGYIANSMRLPLRCLPTVQQTLSDFPVPAWNPKPPNSCQVVEHKLANQGLSWRI